MPVLPKSANSLLNDVQAEHDRFRTLVTAIVASSGVVNGVSRDNIVEYAMNLAEEIETALQERYSTRLKEEVDMYKATINIPSTTGRTDRSPA